MSAKIKCAENIRFLAKLFQDMTEAANILEEVGKGEQAVAECNAAVDVARKELATVTAQLEKAKADLKGAIKSFDGEAVIRRELAEKSAEETKKEADGIVALAKDKAAQIIASAQERAESVIGNANSGVQKLNDEINARSLALDELNKKTADADAQCALAQTRLDELKSKLKGLLD